VEVLRETLNLIIASLPTTIIVFLFYLFARAAFFKPIMRVLDERAARTEGARSDAARLDSQAQEKLTLYHRALDKVRAEIYGEQEVARRAALDERAELLRQTRATANERVRQEKQRLEKELAGAGDQIERESARLAEDAARAVLAESPPVQESTGEAG
jgi:F-type H+-transporting ATPase subunit b